MLYIQGKNIKEYLVGDVGEEIPEVRPTPSASGGNNLGLLRNDEDDIRRGPINGNGGGYVRRPVCTLGMVDGSGEVTRRSRRRGRAPSTRLDSSLTCKLCQLQISKLQLRRRR